MLFVLFEVISGKRVKELKRNYLDTSEQSKTKQIASAINAFVIPKVNLNEVITDVVLNCLPHVKEEMERDPNFENLNTRRVSLDDVSNRFLTYMMTPGNGERDEQEARRKLVSDVLSMFPRNRKK